MDKILDLLSSPDLTDEFDRFVNALQTYRNNNKGYKYADLTKVIYMEYHCNNDKLLYLEANVDEVTSNGKVDEYDEETKENINKLFDHVKLELSRIEFHKQREIESNTQIEHFKSGLNDTIISQLTETKTSLNQEKDNLKKELKEKAISIEVELNQKAKDIENGLSGSVISVLGIFAAFITAFFGGISAFGSIMSSLAGVSVFRVIFIVFLFGIIYFNTCFVLIYSVSRMLNKNIYSNRYSECNSCESIKQYLMNRFKKFPIFFVFNFIMIFGMLIITLVYFNIEKIEKCLTF